MKRRTLVKTCLFAVSLSTVGFVVLDVLRHHQVALPNPIRTKTDAMFAGTSLQDVKVLRALPSDVVLIDFVYMVIRSGYEKDRFSRRSFLGAESFDDFIEKDTILFALKVASEKDISDLKERLLTKNVSLTMEEDGSILLGESKPMIRIVTFIQSSNHDFFTFTIKNTSRMIQSFETEQTKVNNVTLEVPKDCSRFVWMMLRSEFVSCDVDVADKYRKDNPEIFATTPKIGPEFIYPMAKLRDWAVDRGATPMLSSGTLLGWLRECGIIYDTHDLDFMFFIEEYYEGIRDDLQQADFMELSRQFNLPENLLEYRVAMNGRQLDIFFLYNNGTFSWIGGLGGHQKYKFVFPLITRVCTSQLLDHLMYVPCNALDVIKADHGEGWSKPVNGTYHWNSSPQSVELAGTYTDEELRKASLTFQ